MTATEFNNFATEFTDRTVTIYKPEDNSKYAMYYPENGVIEPSTKYGIKIGDHIAFDFKTGKNEDNFFKTFVTQYINKFMTKRMVFENGNVVYLTKEQCIEKMKNNDRVAKSFFYTTLYGIGCFCYFMRQDTLSDHSSNLGRYLKSKSIDFKNEFSEAGWVYRFVIRKKVDIHNQLLEEFEF